MTAPALKLNMRTSQSEWARRRKLAVAQKNISSLFIRIFPRPYTHQTTQHHSWRPPRCALRHSSRSSRLESPTLTRSFCVALPLGCRTFHALAVLPQVSSLLGFLQEPLPLLLQECVTPTFASGLCEFISLLCHVAASFLGAIVSYAIVCQ